jgi:hypothetical protein
MRSFSLFVDWWLTVIIDWIFENVGLNDRNLWNKFDGDFRSILSYELLFKHPW